MLNQYPIFSVLDYTVVPNPVYVSDKPQGLTSIANLKSKEEYGSKLNSATIKSIVPDFGVTGSNAADLINKI